MQFLKRTTHINFMGPRKALLSVSLVIALASLVSIFWHGFNFGIDFTGGTVVEVEYPEAADLSAVRAKLEEGGYERAVVQYFGTSQDVLIRLPPQEGKDSNKMSNQVFALLSEQSGGKAKLKRVDFVGPQVGEDLREKGGLAMLIAVIGIVIYVAMRFEWRFSVAAIVATMHDIVITLGFFSLTQTEFDLNVMSAVLATLGYSLNDTIVVFDRIRENFRKMRKTETSEILNVSINQTLARSIITHVTTTLAVLALLLVGGPVLHGFSLCMLIGIIVGTYSSIYVASPWLMMLGVTKKDLMQAGQQEEGVSVNSSP